MADRAFDVGGDLIADNDLHTGRWKRITALTDATFALGTVCDDIAGTFAGQAIKAGTTVPGTFSALKLSAGSLIAFY